MGEEVVAMSVIKEVCYIGKRKEEVGEKQSKRNKWSFEFIINVIHVSRDHSGN